MSVAPIFPEFTIPNDEDYGLHWVVIGHRIQATVAELTPAFARRLLANNGRNRTLDERRVQQYRADIAGGRWELNGEPIIVAADGRLLSGQHRCHAVAREGATIATVVVRVPNDDVMATIDQGKSRTVGNALMFSGAETKNAPVIRLLYHFLMGGNMTASNLIPMSGPTATMAVERLEGIAESVRAGGRVYATLKGSMAAYAAFHFLTSKTSLDNEHFFAQLRDGIGLTGESPVLHLRNRLIKAKERQSATEVLRSSALWPLIVKAWNAWATGSEVRTLRVGPREDAAPIAGLPDEWRHGAWKS